MQRTYSPEALARREARKAETRARNETKKAAAKAAKAAKQAEWDARAKQWEADRQKQRDDFKASLSEADWADLQEALSEETTRTDATGFTFVTNDWLHSVKEQFKSWGRLSPRQLEPLLKRVRDRREQAAKAEVWPTLQEGDVAKLRCSILGATVERGDFGVFYKIRMLTSYGRKCSLKTTRVDWFEIAKKRKEEGKKVFVQAKIKWVAPEAGGPFVLTSRGAKFGDLL